MQLYFYANERVQLYFYWTWGAESPPTHIMLCSNWLGKTKQANSNVNDEIKLHKIEDKWEKKQAFHFQAFFRAWKLVSIEITLNYQAKRSKPSS